MSSVVIAGDVSGSVTLQAPSAAGSTVINLPTVSGGSFVVSDSSGNVGIGATPSNKLDVYTASGGTTVRAQVGSADTAKFSAQNTTSSFNMAQDGTGGYFEELGAYPIRFFTNSSERMRLDSSGNLGIGTTSPAAKLDVTGTTNFLAPNATNASGSFRFGYGSGGYPGAMMINADNNTGGAYIAWNTGTKIGNDTGTYVVNGYATKIDGQLGILKFLNTFSGTAGADITWSERMRIDTSGNVLVGVTSTTNCHVFKATSNASRTFTALADGASPYGYYANYTGASPNATGNEFLLCNDSTTTRISLRSNGGIANYSANNVNLSDRREKTNFAPAKSYLDVICAIPVQTYNYIDQNMEEDGGLNLGVVAQDVQAVAPELVTESNWGSEEEPKMRLSIYQTDLQYALMKCIQEQQALITQLQADVAALKGQA